MSRAVAEIATAPFLDEISRVDLMESRAAGINFPAWHPNCDMFNVATVSNLFKRGGVRSLPPPRVPVNRTAGIAPVMHAGIQAWGD